MQYVSTSGENTAYYFYFANYKVKRTHIGMPNLIFNFPDN